MRHLLLAFALCLFAGAASAAQWQMAWINPATGQVEPLPAGEGWQVYYDDQSNQIRFYQPGHYDLPVLVIKPTGKIQLNGGIEVYEQGDAIDLMNFVRYGPDNVQDGNFTPTGQGARIAQICPQPWAPGRPNKYYCGAQIGFRADDQAPQSATNGAGFLELRAVRSGQLGPVETQMEVRGIPLAAPVGATGLRVRYRAVGGETMSKVCVGPAPDFYLRLC